MSIEARDPVQMAIQRHMGIDNDKRSQTQQGIAVIIGGGPFAGKTLIARQVCLNLRKDTFSLFLIIFLNFKILKSILRSGSITEFQS